MDFAERFLERVPVFLPGGVTRAREIARQPGQTGPETRGGIAETGKCGNGPRRGETGSARIGIERVVFLYPNVILVGDEKEPQRPHHRLERGLAFKQIDRNREIVREKKLLAPPEKLRAVRARRADAARDWKLARFELEELVQRQVEKN